MAVTKSQEDLNQRVGHVEQAVSSLRTDTATLNTKIDNIGNDVNKLTSNIEQVISSKQTNWPIIYSAAAIIIAVVIGYWNLAKQPYDLMISELNAKVAQQQELIITNKVNGAVLKERLSWLKK